MRRNSHDHRFATKCHAVLLDDLGIACEEIAKQIPSPFQEHFAALADTAIYRANELKKWCDQDWRRK